MICKKYLKYAIKKIYPKLDQENGYSVLINDPNVNDVSKWENRTDNRQEIGFRHCSALASLFCIMAEPYDWLQDQAIRMETQIWH